MSNKSFPADLRILQSVSTVVGARDSLQAINTNIVSDRALVAVAENDSVYMLRKDSVTPPSGTDIVQPTAGPGRWFLYPTASGGSDFDPIQQQRFYDTTSAVTPRNGSIRAPYNTFAALWTEMTTGATGAWELTLPGTAVTIDGVIPVFTAGVAIGLKGLAQDKTVLNAWSPPGQTGTTYIFRDMTVTTFTPVSGSGISVFGENVTFGIGEGSGTFSGTMRLVNCTMGDFGFQDMVMLLDECTISGSIVCQVGSFLRDCKFVGGSAVLSFAGDGFITLQDCDCDGLSEINALGDGTIHVDGYTWQSLINAVIVRSCQMVIMPTPHIFDQIAHASENITGGADLTIDLGETTPRAEPGTLAQATWPSGQPSDSRLVIVNCSIDGSGHAIVVVHNFHTDTLTLTSPEFIINFEPRVASGT